MRAVVLFAALLSAFPATLSAGEGDKPTEWKGAVDAIDLKAGKFAMLVVGKNVPENGKVVPLKLTATTRYVWRTADPKKFLDAGRKTSNAASTFTS